MLLHYLVKYQFWNSCRGQELSEAICHTAMKVSAAQELLKKLCFLTFALRYSQMKRYLKRPYWNFHRMSKCAHLVQQRTNTVKHCGKNALWFVSVFLSFFLFFSLPILNGCRLDVYHTSTHDGLTANLRYLKKVPTFKLSVTLSNLNRISKFWHCWKAYEIC